MLNDDSVAHGEFEIFSAPQDVFRTLYAATGPAILLLPFMWICALIAAALSLLAGEMPAPGALVGSLFGTVFVGAFVRAAFRTNPGDTGALVRLTDDSLSYRRAGSELALKWNAITKIRERTGILVLTGENITVALPFYRMSPVQIGSIRALLDASGVTARIATSRSGGNIRTVLMWLGLLLMFVLVYNYVAQ